MKLLSSLIFAILVLSSGSLYAGTVSVTDYAGGHAIGTGVPAFVTAADLAAHAAGTPQPWLGEDPANYPPGYVAGKTTYDTICLEEALLHAYGTKQAPHAKSVLNSPVIIPAGTYMISGPLQCYDVSSADIEGAGMWQTTLMGMSSCVGADTHAGLVLDYRYGFQYSKLKHLNVNSSALYHGPLCSFGLVTGWNGTTYRYTANCQSDEFEDVAFVGNQTVDIGTDIGSTGMGSECRFLGCRWYYFTYTGYHGNGYNALNNLITGGGFYGCYRMGVDLSGGNVNIVSVAFENAGPQQVGADIIIGNSADDVSTITGCRSEDWHNIWAYNGAYMSVRGWVSTPAIPSWAPGRVRTMGTVILGTNGAWWQCVQAGTSGTTAPTYSTTSYTMDGTAKWCAYSVPIPWLPSTRYELGGWIHASGGQNWRIVKAGTTGATMPAFPTTPTTEQQVTDGTATWEYMSLPTDAISCSLIDMSDSEIVGGQVVAQSGNVHDNLFSRTDWYDGTPPVALAHSGNRCFVPGGINNGALTASSLN